MKRTHVMHKRDNRRAFPSHHAATARDDRDPRCLAWCERSDGAQVMTLDGESVAVVEPFGEGRFDLLGDWVQPHRAIIGTQVAVDCNSLDAARLHCERHFAHAA
ncbi:MAG: hypothetical protein HZC55_04100 [Verrucomicrobia bacterium]|nr:hypothetical protein [Verrucomicrobiota bacterium]